MKRDSIANTIVVAGGLCIVCSLLVSGAAVGLRGTQQKNAELDLKVNILKASGLVESDERPSAEEIEKLYADRVIDNVIDLRTGENVTEKFAEEYGEVGDYNQFSAAKSNDDEMRKVLTSKEDVAGIKSRENYSHVYMVKGEDGNVEAYVFPVRGYGLWSTMYGFLAVENDMQTVLGLTFYEQGETPGLGGEITNEKWKEQWVGKEIYGEEPATEEGAVELRVVKGTASEPELEHKIDGLSGATITSTGVTNLLDYWMGPSGFGQYIEKKKTEPSTRSSAAMVNRNGGENG